MIASDIVCPSKLSSALEKPLSRRRQSRWVGSRSVGATGCRAESAPLAAGSLSLAPISQGYWKAQGMSCCRTPCVSGAHLSVRFPILLLATSGAIPCTPTETAQVARVNWFPAGPTYEAATLSRFDRNCFRENFNTLPCSQQQLFTSCCVLTDFSKV